MLVTSSAVPTTPRRKSTLHLSLGLLARVVEDHYSSETAPSTGSIAWLARP